MGVSRLRRFAAQGAEETKGAVSALLAELQANCWESQDDFMEHFPMAEVYECTAVIPIGQEHCIELKIRYDIGMVLIEFAGVTADRHRLRKKGRKVA